jgi:hypothetical protein
VPAAAYIRLRQDHLFPPGELGGEPLAGFLLSDVILDLLLYLLQDLVLSFQGAS